MASLEYDIDPDGGGDYFSMSAWELAQQQDLTDGGGDTMTAHCESSSGTDDTTRCSIAGWTTLPVNWIKIWTDPAGTFGHDGKWTAGNKYRMIVNNPGSNMISANTANCTFAGLMLRETGTNNQPVWAAANDNITFEQNIVDNNSSGGAVNAVKASGAYDGIEIFNNVIYESNAGSQYGIFISSINTGGARVYNNTVYGDPNINIYQWANKAYMSNNIADGASGGNSDYGYSSTSSSYLSHNLSGDDTADDNGGTGHKINQTVSYVDSGNYDFHLQSGDTAAKDSGTDLSAYTTVDVDNETRSGTWDIGADEIVAVGLSMVIAMHHYKQIHGFQ